MYKKLLLAVLVMVFYCITVSAQTCVNTPVNKTLDLRQVLHPQVLTVTRTYKTQLTKPIGGDVKYAEDFCDIPVNDCDYSGNALVYDVYYPADVDYNTCSLPAIFLFHGGGYTECAGYQADQMISLATEFAKRGFVTFNIEYRRGTLLSTDTGFYTAQQMLASYRADQDARGAIRSAVTRQRQMKTYKEPYSIDTNAIFIGGMSAGSVTAMSVAYYQQQSMFDKVIPGMKDALGSVKADYYLGDTTVSFKIRGVLNLWGGNAVRNQDSAKPAKFFKVNTYMPPMIAFAGEQDPTFNYVEQGLDFVANDAHYPIFLTPLGYESRCTLNGATYRLNSAYPLSNGTILGSKKMYLTLNAMHVPAELYLDTKLKHGLTPQNNSDTINTECFGLPTTNIDSVLSYIAQRGATFFQAVMNNYAFKTGTTMFEDCENYRYANNLANNNACSGIASASSVSASSKPAVTAAVVKPVITIYPNPVRDLLHIQLARFAGGMVTIQISDAGGRLMLTKQSATVNGAANTTTIALPVSSLARGIYYVKVIETGTVSVKKWVKE